jgi:hypothetical protein
VNDVVTKPFAPSSIDARVVRRMFSEDLSLFNSALSRLLRDYAEFAVPLCLFAR